MVPAVILLYSRLVLSLTHGYPMIHECYAVEAVNSSCIRALVTKSHDFGFAFATVVTAMRDFVLYMSKNECFLNFG